MRTTFLSFLGAISLMSALGCTPEGTAEPCVTQADCYPDIDPAQLAGAVTCLDRVEAGYCTHECTNDADCCAVDGVCDDRVKQVCAPFESTGVMLCFLSCSADDLEATGFTETDGDGQGDLGAQFCRARAHPEFGCRSTGGGSANRKVCVPGG
jgi:hypothetical protein